MGDEVDQVGPPWPGVGHGVESLLERIAERAVSELGVEVAVASARPLRDGSVPRRGRSRSSDHAVAPPEPLARGGEVTAPLLEAYAWWPARPGAYPSGLVVDLSGRETPPDLRYRPRLELHAGADFFGTPELLSAARFGAYASLSLLAVERVAHLTMALETRGLISQAQGILMERFGLEAQGAMNLLRRLSQESHRPVRDLALDLATGDWPASTASTAERQSWTP